MSELSEVTATTLNSDSDRDSDTAEGSSDGVQPMTYPTDCDSMAFTSSSGSDGDAEPQPIAKGGFQALPMADGDGGNLSDITSMDGDHDFETMH